LILVVRALGEKKSTGLLIHLSRDQQTGEIV
jgi:hypothetical protein